MKLRNLRAKSRKIRSKTSFSSANSRTERLSDPLHSQNPKSRFKTPENARKRDILGGIAQKRRVLDQLNHDPTKQVNLKEMVLRILMLAQTLVQKKFYAYQIEFAYRVVEAVLNHDGEVLAALMSRQSGKTETLGAVMAALAIMLPALAKKFPLDWRLNITDSNGVYRGFANGIRIGIYAPRKEQAGIMFDRVKTAFSSDACKAVLSELKLELEVSNGNSIKLSNKSKVLCQSASEQSKIEGATHDLLIAEEAQDISDVKIRKSLRPMIASTRGCFVMIGTATHKKCEFYNALKQAQRSQLVTGRKCAFVYPYTITQTYNSMYKHYVDQEKIRLGEESDEFQTSYGCVWIFERGMFVTQNQLFNIRISQVGGMFSQTFMHGWPVMHNYYSIVAGIDWGQSHDSTVLTLMAVNWNAPLETGQYMDEGERKTFEIYNKHVIGWHEWLGDNYETQFGEILNVLNTYPNLRKVVVDANTCGAPMLARLEYTYNHLYPGKSVIVEGNSFQEKSKSDLYRSLYADLVSGRVTFPAGPRARTTKEYRKFCGQMLDLQKEYRGGYMKVSHPDEKDAHDDYPDSFALAAWGCNGSTRTNSVDFAPGNFFYRR